MQSVGSVPDPRSFPLRGGDALATYPSWQAWAEVSMSAATRAEREVAHTLLRAALVEALRARKIDAMESTLNSAQSAAHYRHLWRALGAAWRDCIAVANTQVVAQEFAMAVVIVAAADIAVEVAGILSNVAQLAELLKLHGGLAGNRSFGLANVLAGVDALSLRAILCRGTWSGDFEIPTGHRDVIPSPIAVTPGQQGAHLRFLIGSALASPHSALFEEQTVGTWGMPVAQWLSRELSTGGVQLLALPRPPSDPFSALRQGRLAHREVALQLFASTAIRKLRADFGEPDAVISGHRIDSGGELRLSLSSPFGERDAEGFRCPLYPDDRLEDVLTMIVDLLRACRVVNIRVLPQVHPDRDSQTGLPLFFRADTIGDAEAVSSH